MQPCTRHCWITKAPISSFAGSLCFFISHRHRKVLDIAWGGGGGGKVQNIGWVGGGQRGQTLNFPLAVN